MVVPSDIWCIRNGYTMDYEEMGQTKKIPDYKSAMQNSAEMRAMVSEIADFMQSNDFPIKDLEQELKRLEDEAAEAMMLESKESGANMAQSPVDMLKSNANPDIILDLDFEEQSEGFETFISFNLKAMDAYTSKIISGNTGQGTPGSSSQLTNQLKEAVYSFKDKFLSGLMNHFNDLFENGREIVVNVKRWSDCEIDFETEFGDQELGEIIDDFMAKNTVKGRFTTKTSTENVLRFEQVRIPLEITREDGTTKAIDAKGWGKGLQRFIKKTTGVECKIMTKGLGEVTIIMGGK